MNENHKIKFILYICDMNKMFYITIVNSSAHVKSRCLITNLVVENQTLLDNLSTIAFDVSDKNHYKAIWIFEVIAEKHSNLILPYMNVMCSMLVQCKHQSAVRGLSRILFFLHMSKKIHFTAHQKNKITVACLDWMIGNYKIVPKIMAMHILFDFGKKQPWIHHELKLIIENDFYKQTAGYKNRAKIILDKLNMSN